MKLSVKYHNIKKYYTKISRGINFYGSYVAVVSSKYKIYFNYSNLNKNNYNILNFELDNNHSTSFYLKKRLFLNMYNTIKNKHLIGNKNNFRTGFITFTDSNTFFNLSNYYKNLEFSLLLNNWKFQFACLENENFFFDYNFLNKLIKDFNPGKEFKNIFYFIIKFMKNIYISKNIFYSLIYIIMNINLILFKFLFQKFN